MTREEAISILEEEAEYLYQDDRPYNREAFDMAISALSAEEADGCLGCEYEGLSEFDEPCADCKNNYMNKWTIKKTEPSDLISRADAIKAVEDNSYGMGSRASVKAIKALPSAEQVTSKLKNPCDSLLTEDSEDSKEQKSKLDLISRADVLDLIRDYFVAKIDELPFHTEDGYEVCDDSARANDMLIYNKEIRNKVRALPSVSAERVGEWIYHIDDLFPEESIQECSLCHEHEYIKLNNENYCPSCGARMENKK